MTWPDLLERASDPDEVLKVVRDFLATWDPYELAALPGPCKPPLRFEQAEDVVGYAFNLVQHQCGPGADDAGVARMAAFFAVAARRVAVLMGDVPQRPADNDISGHP